MKTLTLSLIAGATVAVAVEVPGNRQPVGIQAGLGWILPQEPEFQGTTMSVYLYLVPAAGVDVGFLHEEMLLTPPESPSGGGGGEGGGGGADSDHTPSTRGSFDAVRARYRIFDDEIQSARLLASAGYAEFNGSQISEGFAFDLGVEYAPLKLSTAAIDSELSIQLRYRYCRLGTAPASAGARPLENASGFIIGVVGDVRF